jgi:hypothetical protein
MNDSFLKDIVYDLIASKLKIKELEDRLIKLEKENNELTDANASFKADANKWKTQVMSYINDYHNVYISEEENVSTDREENETVNEIVNDIVITDDKTNEDTKKTRSEYMKEYMRNKRKQKKEELKNIIVNKK